MNWISSTGGPLIVLPRSALSLWHGADEGSEDYQLACSVDDYAGVIRWKDLEVFVLGDEPMQTAVRSTVGGIALVRWRYAPSEEAMLECLRPELWGTPVEQVAWTAGESSVLFDSAFPGALADPVFEVPLEAGPHEIKTYVVTPSSEVSAVLHEVRASTNVERTSS